MAKEKGGLNTLLKTDYVAGFGLPGTVSAHFQVASVVMFCNMKWKKYVSMLV